MRSSCVQRYFPRQWRCCMIYGTPPRQNGRFGIGAEVELRAWLVTHSVRKYSRLHPSHSFDWIPSGFQLWLPSLLRTNSSNMFPVRVHGPAPRSNKLIFPKFREYHVARTAHEATMNAARYNNATEAIKALLVTVQAQYSFIWVFVDWKEVVHETFSDFVFKMIQNVFEILCSCVSLHVSDRTRTNTLETLRNAVYTLI